MTDVNSDVPQINAPFVSQNGMITHPWFMLLVQLWKRTGGGVGTDIADIINLTAQDFDLALPNVPDPDIASLSAQLAANDLRPGIPAPDAKPTGMTAPVFGLPNADNMPEMTFSPALDPATTTVTPALAVTVTASPMTITATAKCAISIDGAVTGLTYQRGAWSRALTAAGGIYELSIGDAIVIAYAVAPTIYQLAR